MAAALVALTFLAYSNSFTAGFALDNKGLILDDARVHSATAEHLDQIFRHTYWWPVGESGLYRPFTTLTYLFNYVLLGDGERPAGYHWVNLLLHTSNVLLVWVLARRFWDALWPPALIAAVWAIHPILTEAVTNIAGRADLLAGAAVLSGLLLYLKSTGTSEWRRAAWLAALAAVTTIGVFSKESAVVIPGVILAFELTMGTARGRVRRLLWAGLAVLPPIALMVWQRSAVLAASAPTEFPFTDNPLTGAPFWSARLTALSVTGRYMWLLLWPANLSCDYSFAQIPPATGAARDWLAWLAVAALAGVVVLLWRRNRTGFFVAICTLLVFLPTSNLFFLFGTIMAERFLYLPSIAFSAALVWAAYAAAGRLKAGNLAPIALCCVIAAFALRTYARNRDWQDDLSLSTAAVRVSPRSFKTHKLRANALLASDPSHANIDEVIREAEQSLAILDPLPDTRNHADMYQRAAGYYFMKGDSLRQRTSGGELVTTAASERAYRRALELLDRCARIANRPDAGLQQQRAKLYLRLHESQRALEAATAARALDPANVEAHRTVAGVLVDAGRDHDALVALLEGYLITRDDGLRRTLLNFYGPESCAAAPDGGLNASCPAVHGDLCAAAAAARQLASALRVPGCSE